MSNLRGYFLNYTLFSLAVLFGKELKEMPVRGSRAEVERGLGRMRGVFYSIWELKRK